MLQLLVAGLATHTKMRTDTQTHSEDPKIVVEKEKPAELQRISVKKRKHPKYLFLRFLNENGTETKLKYVGHFFCLLLHTQNSPLISCLKLLKTRIFTNKLLVRKILNILMHMIRIYFIKSSRLSTISLFIIV